MTKKEISDQISDKLGLNRKETLEVVNGVFELIKSEVRKGKPVNFRDFGTFGIRKYPERKVNSFGKGEIIIPAISKVFFKPSKQSFSID